MNPKITRNPMAEMLRQFGSVMGGAMLRNYFPRELSAPLEKSSTISIPTSKSASPGSKPTASSAAKPTPPSNAHSTKRLRDTDAVLLTLANYEEVTDDETLPLTRTISFSHTEEEKRFFTLTFHTKFRHLVCDQYLKKGGGSSSPTTRAARLWSEVLFINFSGLLNFIDGLWGERIIIFTTNYVEKLDPALIRRGRMDMHIELSYCGFEAFKVLAKNYYLKIEEHDMFESIRRQLEETKMTPADVAENLVPKLRGEDKERCLTRLVKAIEEAKLKAKAEEEEKRLKAEKLAKEEEEEEEKKKAAEEEEEKGCPRRREEETVLPRMEYYQKMVPNC